MNIIIVGVGGIGSHLLFPLLQYLKGESFYDNIILVDGDEYEERNKDRQVVTGISMNKAKATVGYYKDMGMRLDYKTDFINEKNIGDIIHEDDIVFSCVDNNATRKVIDNYLPNLSNITLISGGNDTNDGNAQIVMRTNGRYLTKTLCEQHPEISNPEDKSPEDLSCEELSRAGVTQISIVNAGISDIMRRMFFGIINDGINYNETFVNFKNGNIRNTKCDNNLKLDVL